MVQIARWRDATPTVQNFAQHASTALPLKITGLTCAQCGRADGMAARAMGMASYS
jgi:hypothetical protein